MRIETHVDESFLERADSPQTLRRAIEKQRADLETLRASLRREPSELERTRLGRTLNRLSRYLRLVDACDDAHELCEEAIDIWRSLGRDRAEYLARLRLAAIEMRRDHLELADRQAGELIEAADQEPFAVYRDFALELRGRIRAVAGDHGAARRDLEAALAYRRDEGRQRLIDRTDRLLALLDERV